MRGSMPRTPPGLEVVVALDPPAEMKCPEPQPRPGSSPSQRHLPSRVPRLPQRYPRCGSSSPGTRSTTSRSRPPPPRSVVSYYKVVRQICPGCTVLGADIQDLPNMVDYTQGDCCGLSRAHVAHAATVGPHNYTDTNRFLTDRTAHAQAVKLLPGKIWITEIGGLFRFQPQNARQPSGPICSARAGAMPAIFKPRRPLPSQISRVYLYQWFASEDVTAGTRRARRPRPATTGLQRAAGPRRSVSLTCTRLRARDDPPVRLLPADREAAARRRRGALAQADGPRRADPPARRRPVDVAAGRLARAPERRRRSSARRWTRSAARSC